MNELFKGVCPVINIPFQENGEIDHDGIASIVEYAIAEGCKHLSVFAMNSEPNRLTLSEKQAVLKTFIAAVHGRVDTVVGLVEDSLKSASELARFAADHGAQGLILFPPGRVPPAGERLLKYLEGVAASVSLPVMYQDAPRTTGVAVTTEFLIDAHRRIPNLQYAKVECQLPVLRIDALNAATGGKLRCMSGNGGIYTIDAFRRGAWGVMPGVALAGHFVALYDRYAEGNLEAARDIFENLLPLLWFEDQSLEFFIACEKQILFEKAVIGSTHIREHGLTLCDADIDELHALLSRLKPSPKHS